MTTRHFLFGLVIALAAPACTVSGHGTITGTATVVYQEPPQPQVETITVERPGHIFVKGHWDWKNGQWSWIGGHWERERSGSQWQEGRWERRGNSWYWVEGRWVAGGAVVVAPHDNGPVVRDHREGDGGAVNVGGGGSVTVSVEYPTAAPPPVRVETQAPKAGHVWARGHWDWKAGKWDWVPGHWERERANKVWAEAHWEQQGNRWVFIEGTWR